MGCGLAAIPLGAVRYGDSARGMNPLTRWACSTDRKENLNGIAGWDFVMEQESCDLGSKQNVVTVWAWPAEGLAQIFTPRKMLFRYVPQEAESSWPFIKAVDGSGGSKGEVVLYVPVVESVLVQNRMLGEAHVRYLIGRTDLPPGMDPQPAP